MSYCCFNVGEKLGSVAFRARLGFCGVCALNLCYVLSLGVVGRFPELLNASLQCIITL